jgi:hypothetical protein
LGLGCEKGFVVGKVFEMKSGLRDMLLKLIVPFSFLLLIQKSKRKPCTVQFLLLNSVVILDLSLEQFEQFLVVFLHNLIDLLF